MLERENKKLSQRDTKPQKGGKGGCAHAVSYFFTFSFKSASSSVNSYISASDRVLSLLALFNFFSRSLILFFMSFWPKDCIAFTSILLPAPSNTSSFGPKSVFFSS